LAILPGVGAELARYIGRDQVKQTGAFSSKSRRDNEVITVQKASWKAR
jgi:hypothetical protein